MTERELASKFTPPDPKLAAVRNFIISKLEEDIVQVNTRILHEAVPKLQSDLISWRDGIAFAVYSIRVLIDGDGKILREDLYPELEHLFKENSL